MSERIVLLHPEYLTITGTDGVRWRGADQDWFPTFWQQRAGCGPTAAAVLTAYLAQSGSSFAPLFPEGSMDQKNFTAHMCRVWDYVTPGVHGLNRPALFAQGLEAYGAACGVLLRAGLLELPARRALRPDWAAWSGFIRAALNRDRPVAFLNLSNGKVKELDYWHWVTIIGLEGDAAIILDSGKELSIDLFRWLATTTRRAGLVTVL